MLKRLNDPAELAHLKADAILFHHIYCKVVLLGKSCELNKNVFKMNQHYLELKLFLSELEHDPEIVMNRDLHQKSVCTMERTKQLTTADLIFS